MDIRDLLIQRMKEKKLDKVLLGTMAFKQLNRVLGRDDVTGYIKNRILFIKTYDQSLRIQIFHQKVELIIHLNEYLQKNGLPSTIKELKLL